MTKAKSYFLGLFTLGINPYNRLVKTNKISKKTYWKLFGLSLISFGIAPYVIIDKAKNQSIEPTKNTTLPYSKQQLDTLLGETSNITSVKLVSNSLIEFNVVNLDLVQQDALKNLTNAIGVLKGSNKISLMTKDASLIAQYYNLVQSE